MRKYADAMYLLLSLVLFTMAVCADSAYGGRTMHEKKYQAMHCKGLKGQTEVIMPDESRCDCLTNTYAIEYDFADKWAESIGQALLYSAFTDRPPAVAIILEKETDERYLERIEVVRRAFDLPITILPIYGY